MKELQGANKNHLFDQSFDCGSNSAFDSHATSRSMDSFPGANEKPGVWYPEYNKDGDLTGMHMRSKPRDPADKYHENRCRIEEWIYAWATGKGYKPEIDFQQYRSFGATHVGFCGKQGLEIGIGSKELPEMDLFFKFLEQNWNADYTCVHFGKDGIIMNHWTNEPYQFEKLRPPSSDSVFEAILRVADTR